MKRFLPWLVASAILSALAEWALAVQGHWPVGFAAGLGFGGVIALALGGEALAGIGLQRPDPDRSETQGS